MRLLLDESVPGRLLRSLTDHSVRTVVEAGWSGVKNGKLLALAAAEFDAFITVDKNLPFSRTWPRCPLRWLYSTARQMSCRHSCHWCLRCYLSSSH